MSITMEPSFISNILGCGVSSPSQSILIVDCEGEDTPKSAHKDTQNTDAFSISLLSHLLRDIYKILLGSSKMHAIQCHYMV